MSRLEKFSNVYLGAPFEPPDGYNELYKGWLEYYRKAEMLDRAQPHRPARYPSKGVIPIRSPWTAKRRIKVSNMLHDIARGIPNEVVRDAKRAAIRDFDRELKICDCRSCREENLRRS